MSGLLDRLASLASCPALPVRARVLLVLVCHADKEGRAYPSVPGIARRIGSTPRVVRKSLSELEAAGAIECSSRGRGGRSRGMTAWVVAPSATADAWQSLVSSGPKGGPGGAPFDDERVSESDPLSEAKEAQDGQPLTPERVSKSAERVSPQDPKGCPPRTPEPSTNPVQPLARAGARGPTPVGEVAAAPRPAEAPPPAARPGSGDVASETPIADVTEALLRTRFRACGNAIVRRGMIRTAAERLVLCGITVDDVRQLAELADAKSKGDPGALLAAWIDRDQCRAVLDEQRSKAKERGLRRRGAPEDGDPGTEPKASGSLLDDVVRGARSA